MTTSSSIQSTEAKTEPPNLSHRLVTGIRGHAAFLLVIGISFLIRAVPELLVSGYPVGFDLLNGYYPALVALPDTGPLKVFGWAGSPLVIYILWFFWKISQLNVLTFLKVAGPAFYAIFCGSFYYFLRKGLGWAKKECLVVTLVFLLQPAILRTSWDQLREEFGLALLFVLLVVTKMSLVQGVRSKPLVTISLSVFIVLSHQLAAVLLFVVVAWQSIELLVFKKKRYSSLAYLLAYLPAALILLAVVYLTFGPQSYSSHFGRLQLPNGSEFFVFTNYYVSDFHFSDGNYVDVLEHVANLSLYTVIPLIPFAIVRGFRKDNVIAPIFVWMLIASYSILLSPAFALQEYWWWILLLPIPLTVYLGNYLNRTSRLRSPRQLRLLIVALILVGVVGFGYASTETPVGYPYAFTYMPSGLVVTPVNIQQIPQIEGAMAWANDHLEQNASVIVPEKIEGFAFVYLSHDFQILVAPPGLNLESALDRTSTPTDGAYVIDYTTDLANVAAAPLTMFGNLGVYRILQ